jgi:hypothetical protein
MYKKMSGKAASKCDTDLQFSTRMYWQLSRNSCIYSTSLFPDLINDDISAKVVNIFK